MRISIDGEWLFRSNVIPFQDFLKWVFTMLATTAMRGLRSVPKEIAMNVQKSVPNRSRPRPPSPKPHGAHANKPL
jgi:hypothetical protein